MFERFTSRKFLLGVSAFVALMLSTVGVIDMSKETEITTGLSMVLYIVVEGAIDFVRSLVGNELVDEELVDLDVE